MWFLFLQLYCRYHHLHKELLTVSPFSLEDAFAAAQLLPVRRNRCLALKRSSQYPNTHTHSVCSPDHNIVCRGAISKTPITPQRLSLISHEWLSCCDVWNHGRCEFGCETVFISYVTALRRPGGLHTLIHSPLAANHATNDKWNIWLPLITMASQGQDLTGPRTQTSSVVSPWSGFFSPSCRAV